MVTIVFVGGGGDMGNQKSFLNLGKSKSSNVVHEFQSSSWQSNFFSFIFQDRVNQVQLSLGPYAN
jgi:hypothetical protein